MKFFKKLFFSWLIFSVFTGCNCNNPQKKIDAKAAEIAVKLNIVRFDKELFQTHDFTLLEKNEPIFYKIFTQQILQDGQRAQLIEPNKLLTDFTQNKYVKDLYDSVEKQYNDFSVYETGLNKAFQYHQYYFPNSNLPKIYTYVSAFQYGCITADNMIGVGLDMFLGSNFSFYPKVQIPQFIIKKCKPDFLVPTVMKVYGQKLNDEGSAQKRLIDKMIENGKVLYYLDKVLPYTNDTLKIGYSEIQLLWCGYNEYKIWEFFIKHNLLYNTDVFEIGHYIGDAPVTPGMPPGAPGNIGSWVGWQIVKKYMNENPKVTLPELFNENDGQKILEKSKYKPQKK
jgi:hypothetical protein